jgi:prepilin-type N-terminal cleavage/methylation domain-containing protein
MKSEDEGFTVVELIVALAVLSVAMAGIGVFFVNGTSAVSQQRDERQASQIAATALEQIRALEGKALLLGRGSTATADQWKTALQDSPFKSRLKPYLDSMKMESDAKVDASAGAEAALPTETKSLTLGGIEFKQTIIVGGCEVYFEWTDDCVNPDTATKKPADATTVLRYFRVVVLETWPHKSCADTGGRCAYIASTLVSRASEPIFNFQRPSPVIRDTTVNPMTVFYAGLDTQSYTFKATGGSLPNTWKFTGLPAGLTGNSAGLISGKPAAAGTVTNVTAEVTDAQGRSHKLSNITIRVITPPVVTLSPAAPRSSVGQSVTIQAAATGGDTTGTPRYTFSAVDLPKEMTLDPVTGAITGSPLVTYTATVLATDVNKVAGQVTFTHTVYPKLQLPAPAAQSVNTGTAANIAMSASGGYGAYTYTATDLPVGLSINASTGRITGIALTPGRYLPTVKVTDSLGMAVSARFELRITTAIPVLGFSSPASEVTTALNQTVNLPVTLTNAANNGSTLTAVGLPPGIKWNNGKDALTGAPTLAGTYLVTLTAVSVVPAQTAITTFVWTVA